ncbi:hypothetical protein RJT34_12809 [Clitoria ternatea]|uniref:Callose synthase helical domain-containing protein n=1 Tax=Clitoria ternatea TaxID=43366 RepID=A0AAN9JMR9_CLITE
MEWSAVIDADSFKRGVVVVLLQDMLEVFSRDMMVNEISELVELNHISKGSGRQPFGGTDTKPLFLPLVTSQREEQVRHLHLLLMVKESAIEVPTNLEASRRIAFFTNLLFMDMPRAPRVCEMLSFSTESLVCNCGLCCRESIESLFLPPFEAGVSIPQLALAFRGLLLRLYQVLSVWIQ